MQERATEHVSKVVSLVDGLTVPCYLSDLLCVFWFVLGAFGFDGAGRDGTGLEDLGRGGSRRAGHEHGHVHELERVLFGVSDNSVWAVSCDESLLVFNGSELMT